MPNERGTMVYGESMSEWRQRHLENLADALLLHVQKLRSSGFLKETATLLNLDYASQAAQAPYLFDMARGILHRKHCAALPHGSRSTLYALWELREGDDKLACPICCCPSGEQSQLEAGVWFKHPFRHRIRSGSF